jgi:hypothetical protein
MAVVHTGLFAWQTSSGGCQVPLTAPLLGLGKTAKDEVAILVNEGDPNDNGCLSADALKPPCGTSICGTGISETGISVPALRENECLASVLALSLGSL